MLFDIRIGHGFDVHPFAAGRRLILGGVEIPHDRGLLGHSDADCLLHAVTDALLGALALGDIGQLYPNTDRSLAGADSTRFLREVWSRATADGWTLVNCDCVILAQAPRLQPYVVRMRERIAECMNAAASQVGVKATTTERLGFVGREEGIAASAVVLLRRG